MSPGKWFAHKSSYSRGCSSPEPSPITAVVGLAAVSRQTCQTCLMGPPKNRPNPISSRLKSDSFPFGFTGRERRSRGRNSRLSEEPTLRLA